MKQVSEVEEKSPRRNRLDEKDASFVEPEDGRRESEIAAVAGAGLSVQDTLALDTRTLDRTAESARKRIDAELAVVRALAFASVFNVGCRGSECDFFR